MSLVLEALRRVEKPNERTGSIGAAVSSYRPTPRRRGFAIPLLLGFAVGGAALLLFTPPSGQRKATPGPNSNGGASGKAAPTRSARGGAGLPPPLILEPMVRPEAPRPRPAPSADMVAAARDRRAELSPLPGPARPAFVLQAISERDSHPIAIINDQLVREGDKLGTTRVLKIGADSVEVLLESGKKDFVRFAPPPPPDISPSPDPRPEGAPPLAFHS